MSQSEGNSNNDINEDIYLNAVLMSKSYGGCSTFMMFLSLSVFHQLEQLVYGACNWFTSIKNKFISSITPLTHSDLPDQFVKEYFHSHDNMVWMLAVWLLIAIEDSSRD